ncbi:MAG: WGR domain-containing protein [Acidobacteria bacterium]|nr:WGR domain-containing protein [Acidobacteriota bacterium]
MTVVMQSIDPDRNRHREYGMEIQPTLFGEYALIRWWHRIGQKPQKMEQWFDSMADALEAQDQVIRLRQKHGYARLVPGGINEPHT